MRLLAGILLLLPACYLAWLAGRFGFFLRDLGSPGHCSEGYLDPRSRLLIFQLPVFTLTAIAVLLLPHWGLSLLATALVIATRQFGRAYGRRLAVRDMADHLIREQRLDRSAALAQAKKTIASAIEVNRTLRAYR